MQFPYFQFPLLGDPLAIAIDAVLHVFISHGVAIGMIAMIVAAELIGWRRGDGRWETFARKAVKPAVILITGLGAVTGVGIWFITSGLVPTGIGAMLRVFFWPWFIEWVVFFLEVVVVLIYYFTWTRWTGPAKRHHVILGLLYVAMACMSAFLITGILGFMLTSDGWPSNRGFWGAFFNPSFLPQLAWRVCISLAMGALFVIFYLLFAYRHEMRWRREALRLYTLLLAAPLILMPVVGLWWYRSVPPGFRTHAMPSLLIWTFAQNASLFWLTHAIAGVIVLAMLAAGLGGRVWPSRLAIVPAIAVVLFFVAEYERVREFIRGPYLIPGYMYANTVLLTEHDLFAREGMLPNACWFQRLAPQPTLQQEGGFLFAANCGTCHTIGGRNDIRDRFRGRSERGIYVLIGRTGQMVPWMPPFSGTDEERAKLAHFIQDLLANQYRLQRPARFPPASEGLPP